MNRQLRDEVWRAGFKPTVKATEVEIESRRLLGLESRYEAAQLAIGRSLAEPVPPPSLPAGSEYGKPIPGEYLFGDQVDLWISLFIVDAVLGQGANINDFRSLVEAHWDRGARLINEDLEKGNRSMTYFLRRLASYLPTQTSSSTGSLRPIGAGAIKVKVGPISVTFPQGEPVELVVNERGYSPHIAFMGKTSSGKTTTAVQVVEQVLRASAIPFLIIDPKGDFASDGSFAGRLSTAQVSPTVIRVGHEPIPLDFLPSVSGGSVTIHNSVMRLRDSIVRCCKAPGDIQRNLLKNAIEKVIKSPGARDLNMIKSYYRSELDAEGKNQDSIYGRLDELTTLHCFSPTHQSDQFFSKSWILSLNALQSEELKRLVILLVLDAFQSYLLNQSDASIEDGYTNISHLLMIDEARRILAEKKYESLVDIVRQGRSKGSVVVLLSQDPSDFAGQADDFTTQLGTVVAFACSQSKDGLKALQGVYGRKVQQQEFVDTHLPKGVAFAKLPNRSAERIKCWE